jgi:hypothetical protein
MKNCFQEPMQSVNESRKRLKSHLAALLVFTFLTGVMTYPLGIQAWNGIDNYGDPLLNAWTLAWDVHQLTRDPLRLFQANNFYPYPNTLAYSENLLAIAVLAVPFLLLTGNPVWTHNLFLLLSFVLCGWTAYLLVYDQTRKWIAGIVAGGIYAFAHYRWGHISHLQLLSAQWLPLIVLYLRRLLQRRRQSRDAVMAAGFFILQALSCTYYAFYSAMAGLLYLLCSLLTSHSMLNWRLLRGIMLGAAIVLLILVPIVIPYLQARSVVGEFGLEAQSGARLVAWITAAEGTVLGSIRPFDAFGKRSEHTFFPGIVALVLALCGLVCHRPVHKGAVPDRIFYIALILLAWVLALGPELRLMRGQGPVLEPLPYALFYRLPGLSAMRVPARMVQLVMLGIAALAGSGTVALLRLANQWGPWIMLVSVALMILDYCPVPLQLRPISVGLGVPAVYRWLAAQRPGSPIVEIPAAESIWFLTDGISPERLARQQYFSSYHWQPTIMGYSGMYPPLFREHIDHLLSFPSDEVLAYLRSLDVRYILVHWSELRGEQSDALRRRLRSAVERGELLSQGWLQDVQVLELAPAEAQSPAIQLYCPPDAPFGNVYHAYLLIRTPEDRAVVNTTLTHFQFHFKWRDTIADLGERLGDDHAIYPGSAYAVDPQRSEGQGILPLTIGPGGMVIPLAVPLPPSPISELELACRVFGEDLYRRQAVRRTETQETTEDTGFLAVDIPGSGGAHWRVERPYEDGLVLSQVSLPRGRVYMAGDTVNVTLAWRNEIEAREHVPTISVQLYDPVGNRVAQRDMVLANGLCEQQDWQAGQVVLDRHLLSLPLWLPPGQYEILISPYELHSVRLLGSRVHVGPIVIERPPFDVSAVEHPQLARMGEHILFRGYSLSEDHAPPGGRVWLTLFWEPLGPIRPDHTVFTHLLGPQGMVTQADGQPGGGAYPTSVWVKGQIVEDRYEWAIPEDSPPGRYAIEVGMYELDTGERLPVFSQEGDLVERDRIPLGLLSVALQPR